jgi:hypothetical protein
MNLVTTTLPWSGAPVSSTGDISSYLRERLTPELRGYLPHSITVYADCEIAEQSVLGFVSEMAQHLEKEFQVRKTRRNRFVELNLFGDAEIDSFLHARCALQPWVLYYSRDGGLRTRVLNPQETKEPFGVVPCATMQNHGVAWKRVGSNGNYELWLVTARKEGHDWDWDSDIGHESAHAAFAQIPLYVQTDEKTAASSDLTLVDDVKELTKLHFARMSYMYMETAVVSFRGEERETESRLPLAERADELYSFLKLSHKLMPDLGFDRALSSYELTNGKVDCSMGVEIFEIGAPALRVVPHLSKRINDVEVPDALWFRSISQNSR